MGWVFFQAGNPEFPVWAADLFASAGDAGSAIHDHDDDYVNVAGDTMEGPLILGRHPVEPMEAATKVYADATGGGPGGGTDEIWIGPTDPHLDHPTIELWYDPDALVLGAPGGGPTTYVHNQSTPASTWVIDHNLGIYPNVTVEDSAGTTVEGEIVHNSINQMTLTFSAAFSGIAYLS